MTLTIHPLRTEGKVLLLVGRPLNIATDYLHTRRAIVEECRERGWSMHKRSDVLVRFVAGVTPPQAVVKSEGGMLLAVYVGGVA